MWTFRVTQGDVSNYKRQAVEPADHAIGRSRGGLTTKLHTLVDGHGLPLVIEAGPGQGGDSPMLTVLLGYLRVARCGPGRPRTTPQALLGDKAYSSRATRKLLRDRGITTVIPEPADQQGHRRRRGSAGGRPVGHDVERYKDRNVIERSYEKLKQWRGLATRYDKLAVIFRGGAILRSIVLWLRTPIGDTP